MDTRTLTRLMSRYPHPVPSEHESVAPSPYCAVGGLILATGGCTRFPSADQAALWMYRIHLTPSKNEAVLASEAAIYLNDMVSPGVSQRFLLSLAADATHSYRLETSRMLGDIASKEVAFSDLYHDLLHHGILPDPEVQS